MKQTPSIFETIADYGTDASARRSANTLEQIQATQELEAAKKSGDKEAYARALVRLNTLKKQAKIQHNIDGTFYIISGVFLLIAAIIVIGTAVIIIHLIFG